MSLCMSDISQPLQELMVAELHNTTDSFCGTPRRDNSAQYRIVSFVLSTVSTVVVFLRCSFKCWTKRPFWTDDWLILLSLAMGLFITATSNRVLVPNGLGRDIWTLSPDQISEFFLYLFIIANIYVVQSILLKLAMVYFYLRIFALGNTNRLLYATAIFIVCYLVGFGLASIFECQPVNCFWKMWDGEHRGQCFNINAFAWSHAIIGIALDLWMLALPLREIQKLTLSWRKKLGIVSMFCVGTG